MDRGWLLVLQFVLNVALAIVVLLLVREFKVLFLIARIVFGSLSVLYGVILMFRISQLRISKWVSAETSDRL